ncbi:MAG: lamin tail domain-containing protein [Bacteroidales bacterium]|nr:lamin tail domain-containing protein [Bacteroidales bacterium]
MVSDSASKLIAKRLVMDSVPNFTWTDANGGNALETSLASTTVGGYSFFFWPTEPTSTFNQTDYRFFENTDTTDVGAPLAAQNVLGIVETAASAFRLRALMYIEQVELPISGESFKLQFAGKGSGTCAAPLEGVPAVYTDVTAATIIAFNDNITPADDIALAANDEDPQHGAVTTANQTYEELNNFTNSVSAISVNETGQWDFALKENGVTAGTAYCFRMVKADGSLLNSYDTYPEIILSAPVYINEVYASGVATEDWVELYNYTSSTASLIAWKLNYIESTIDLGGTPTLLWTGQAGDEINAVSTFTITTSTDLVGGQSYYIELRDNADNIVSQVQWPGPGVLSTGQTFARVIDGGAFFEVDPTPTKNYANHISTNPMRINEVAHGALGEQFIEIYNTSLVSTETISGYTFRNSAASENGSVFEFTKIIYPQNYAVIDFSSYDDDGTTPYTGVFGALGLTGAGDFLTLENSAGQTIDEVTWQTDSNYSRYNNKAQKVDMESFAPGNASLSIMRQPSEGSDNDIGTDFIASVSSTTIASRNNTPATATANTLEYPLDIGAPLFLSRTFPLTLTIGAVSSSATANNIIFERTGGEVDIHSPHIYRLQDIGFDIQALTSQTTVQVGFSFNDQDGYPLISSSTYRVTLNTDTGTESAPQIILSSVTYEDSIHSVSASTVAPLWMNNDSRDSAIKIDVSNNSPAGFNLLEITTITFKIMDSDLAEPLNTAQAQNLFDGIMLVRDSTSTGVYGTYESGIDISTIAYVPMASISLDAAGLSTLTVTTPDLLSASIPAGSTRTFYLVFASTQNASDRTLKVFRVNFNPGSLVILRDGLSDYVQELVGGAEVNTDSVTLISPAQTPANTNWPYSPPESTNIESALGYYIYYPSFPDTDPIVSSSVYAGFTDGNIRAVNKDGTLKWEYASSPISPITTSPNIRIESNSVYIYFATDNGDIYKVQDNNGSAGFIWKQSLGATVVSGIMDIDTSAKFYFGTSDNKVHCLNKVDGSNCGAGWPATVSANPVGLMSIDDRATINTGWIGLEDGNLVALGTVDGSSPNSYLTGDAIKTSPFSDARVIDPNNLIYFTSTDGKLYAQISATLSEKPAGWAADFYEPLPNSPIYSSPNVTFSGAKYIFFGNEAGQLHKVDGADGTSNFAGWPFQAGGAIRSLPIWVPGGAVGIDKDYVYFGCDDGYIYAVDADTGELRNGWPIAAGGQVRGIPVIETSDNTLTIGSTDGKVYVVCVASTTASCENRTGD